MTSGVYCRSREVKDLYLEFSSIYSPREFIRYPSGMKGNSKNVSLFHLRAWSIESSNPCHCSKQHERIGTF